ncbi:EamA family transporter [Clostridium sp. SM-530-WT-3G]|uniref:DMT family transporter n=1 Tax=Clostridium sp. SM-530-WT-3G TaxID=2725303 RepID=UPI00145E5A7B|nr:EamA family transporter [Clostridium sp. SM-530-WT-3G]NME83200.1 EamA family transporter [Clostridium sp. SM-530-WT-3G]
MKKSLRLKGIFLVTFGTLLWGVSGTTAQYLFQAENFTPEWLVTTRMLLSGAFLLIVSAIKRDKNLLRIWKRKDSVIRLILFSLLGMLGVQYAYFAAINHGNAATATILQYLAPIIITFYMCIHNRKLPTLKQLLCVTMAMLGTFLIITKGNMNSLSISKEALFWGIVTAFASALYTLQPVKLIKEYGSICTVGWAMLIGGVAFCFVNSPFNCTGNWTPKSILAVAFVMIFGTIIAFSAYMESLKYIEPYEASILGCIEPLSAAFLSIMFMNVTFSWVQWLGTILIIVTVSILSVMKK